MRDTPDREVVEIINSIRDMLAPSENVYLVGGAVRDILLGQPLHDLDFVMDTDPTRLAKKIARAFKVGYYVLDDERRTARVVYAMANGQPFPLDFVTFTGGSLVEDLKHRDFTINAMALDVRDRETLIDPLTGEADLQAGALRLCNPQALRDDPVRVLRAVRLAQQFNFAFVPGLDTKIRQAAERLPETSRERQRDELFRILEGSEPAKGLQQCLELDILRYLIPELSEESDPDRPSPFAISGRGLERGVLKKMDSLLGLVMHDKSDNAPDWLEETRATLAPYMDRLRSYLRTQITPGRHVLALLLLAAMLQDFERVEDHEVFQPTKAGDARGRDEAGGQQAWQIARRLALSNAEGDFLRTLIEHRDRLTIMVEAPIPPDRRAIYQFYQQTGLVGVAVVLLAIAIAASSHGEKVASDDWQACLGVSKGLLSAWWDAHEDVVDPPLMLDGNDLQREFGLKPGARIGALLGALREAQASGEVGDKEQARAFIRRGLKD